MGLNAQTSVPVFVAGQILTAQQQTEINTGIPVFANDATRNAAFGGAGEKTLAQGQVCFVEGVGLQFFDGTNFVAAGFTSPYTPVFSALTTPAALGNGTLTGRFYRYENYIFFQIVFVAGSTTTFGTGAFTFTLPTALGAANNYGYVGTALDAGTAHFPNLYGVGNLASLADKFILLSPNGLIVDTSNPFTFTTNDQIRVMGSYLID